MRDGAGAVPVESLAEALAATGAAIVARIQGMQEAEFDTALDPNAFPIPVERPTIASLLTLFLFHEAYHSGQIGLCRRVIGKNPGLPF